METRPLKKQRGDGLFTEQSHTDKMDVASLARGFLDLVGNGCQENDQTSLTAEADVLTRIINALGRDGQKLFTQLAWWSSSCFPTYTQPIK
jgi:hypothetical protein